MKTANGQFEVNFDYARRTHHRRSGDVLQDGNELKTAKKYGAIATHMAKPFSRPHWQRACMSIFILADAHQRRGCVRQRL